MTTDSAEKTDRKKKHYCLRCRKETLHNEVGEAERHGLPVVELECPFCRNHTFVFVREEPAKAEAEKAAR